MTPNVCTTYLDKLLSFDDETAAYWLGFLIADGHFSEKRLQITLSSKDSEHLKKFIDWLGHPRPLKEYDGKAAWAIQEPENMKTLRETFGIESRKTYFPLMGLPYPDEVLNLCFMIGLIDGDGAINKQSGGRGASCVRVKMHSAWETWLRLLATTTKYGTVSIEGLGYVVWGIYKHSDVVELKTFAQKNQLPILSRKWDRVDTDYVTRGMQAPAVREMILAGERNSDIACALGVSPASVATMRYRMKKER